MKRLCLALCTATGLLAALPASAQFQKPEDAIKYRKASFTVMAAHFGRIGAMVNGKAPFDAKAAAENAALLAALAPLPGTAFGPGTDKVRDPRRPGDLDRVGQVQGRHDQDDRGGQQAQRRSQDR